ncbi:anti-sigma factor [Gloeobacter morelensis]|uniref:Regulator of SigK n=1 Tax=Gloeobacter morelensis MG652769 TaxID=2781736 RepID=A0ABY3PNE6_9CYAN|nr:anti-sigma factor [Gloeobacter morelensis]UFP94927.1 anti-sigma factor [Gloeobacter morelensis MG652769]
MNRQPGEWEELMAGYVLGDLSDEERRTFEAWLAKHPEARAELARLQETLSLLPYALPEDNNPSAALRNRILEASNAQPAAGRRTRSGWLPWAASAVAAALVVTLGFDSWQLRAQLTQSRQEVGRYRDLVSMLQQDTTRLVSLRGMDSARSASGNILITPGTPEVVVTLGNLPMPARGEVYRLWAVVDGRKVACGEFMPGEAGSVYVKLPLNGNFLTAPLVVTRERGDASQAVGPMVMTSSI